MRSALGSVKHSSGSSSPPKSAFESMIIPLVHYVNFIELAIRPFLFNPLSPTLGGEMWVIWGAPPNPRQHSAAP